MNTNPVLYQSRVNPVAPGGPKTPISKTPTVNPVAAAELMGLAGEALVGWLYEHDAPKAVIDLADGYSYLATYLFEQAKAGEASKEVEQDSPGMVIGILNALGELGSTDCL